MTNMTEKGKVFGTSKLNIDLSILECPSLGHRMLERLTKEHKDLVIYIDVASGEQWKGAQLAEKVLNVASALVDKYNFQQGTVVCISYENSIVVCILTLAVICAGGTVVCAFHKDPYDEVLYLARKVRPRFLFCHQKKLKWAKQLEADMGYQIVGVALDHGSDSSASFKHIKHFLDYDHRQSEGIQKLPVACKDISQDIAVVTMSSGTTGKPKAVPITHKVCLLGLTSHFCQLPKMSIIPCTSSFDYVSGRTLLLRAIEKGFTALILNGFEPKMFLETVQLYKAKSIYLGAAAFYELITFKDIDNYDISSVDSVFPMGARITFQDEMIKFFSKNPQIAEVIEAYGATEIAGAAISLRTPKEYLREDCNNGIELLQGYLAKVVDSGTGKSLGYNQQGVLHVKSEFNFPGYFDANLVNESANDKNINGNRTENFPFIRDSTIFDEDDFYITGDIVYISEGNHIHMIGRENERMSCRNAKKVLPQEIESVLCEHPAVSKVCVLGIPDRRVLTLDCPRAFIVVNEEYNLEAKEPSTPSTQNKTNEEIQVEDEILEHKGVHKLSSIPTERRRRIAEDIMKFSNEHIGLDKHLRGGIVILDHIQILRTGKINKHHLRSLTTDQVEIYGDRSC